MPRICTGTLKDTTQPGDYIQRKFVSLSGLWASISSIPNAFTFQLTELRINVSIF